MFSLLPDERTRGLSVRSAEPSDRAFLRALYAAARVDADLLALWPAEQREPFLDDQFRFQDTHYRRFYPAADFLVIEEDNVAVGRLVLDRSGDHWLIVDIALVPPSRSQGLGTSLLRAIQRAAAAAGAGVRLEVEIVNRRAHALYSRLGFAETDRSGTHIAMAWRR